LQVNPRRLYRSRDRQLAGVAGGMAEYLDIDPTVMRILWILVGLLTAGFAILAYIVLAIVIPDAPWAPSAPAPAGAWGQGYAGYPSAPPASAPASGWATAGAAGAAPSTGYAAPSAGYAPSGTAPAASWGAYAVPQPRTENRRFGAAAIVGVVFVVIGAVALADVVIPGWVAPAALGPAILIAIGAAFVVSSIRRSPAADNGGATTATTVPPIPPASAAAPAPMAPASFFAAAPSATATAAAPGAPAPSPAAADEAETTAIAVPVVDSLADDADANPA
jgi:phage shock protein PspC (stress-responsive transcriptional regulator)